MPKQGLAKNLIADHWGKISAAIVALGTPIVTVAVEPVRDVVFHAIWKEQVEIVGDVRPARVGDEVSLRIVAAPGSWAVGISGGVVSFTSQNGLLKPLTPISVEFDKSDAPLIIPVDGDVKFAAMAPGTDQILVSIKTRYGDYSRSLPVTIEPPIQKTSPKNFSGVWKVRFNNDIGYMDITDRNGEIVGFVSMGNEGKKLAIHGLRDGKVFDVHIEWNDVSRWVIEGHWELSGDFIQIDGSAAFLTLGDGKWLEQENKSTFVAVAVIN